MLGFAVYELFFKGKALQNLTFFPQAVQSVDMSGANPVLNLGILVQNTSSSQLTLYGLAGNLTANGTLVGNLSSFTPTIIPPTSQTVVYVQIRLALLGIVNDIIRAIQYGNFQQDLVLNGSANVDSYQIPLDLTFKIGGAQ